MQHLLPPNPPVSPCNKDSFNKGCDAPEDIWWDVAAREGDALLSGFLSHFLLKLTLKFYCLLILITFDRSGSHASRWRIGKQLKRDKGKQDEWRHLGWVSLMLTQVWVDRMKHHVWLFDILTSPLFDSKKNDLCGSILGGALTPLSFIDFFFLFCSTHLHLQLII